MEKLILRTPLIPFSNEQIYLKPENLQMFGSYKIRGIVSLIADADPTLLKEGLSAASAGNMAQAVAYVAQKLNIPCRIFIPDSAPQVKKEMIIKLKAELIELPFQDVWAMVRGDRKPPEKGIFIHPAYNDSLRKGYSSIAHEIIEDMPQTDAIVIPFGVGGLSLGIGMAMRKLKPDIAIYTCEPETAAPLKKSLSKGQALSVERIPSFVDAIGTSEVLPWVYKQLAPILKDSIVVSLNEIRLAMKSLLFNNKMICEGAAGCSLAAAIRLAETGKHEKIACIISGGNVSPDVLASITK